MATHSLILAEKNLDTNLNKFLEWPNSITCPLIIFLFLLALAVLCIVLSYDSLAFVQCNRMQTAKSTAKVMAHGNYFLCKLCIPQYILLIIVQLFFNKKIINESSLKREYHALQHYSFVFFGETMIYELLKYFPIFKFLFVCKALCN